MTILGIDYGRKKMGLAIATGALADPYKVIKFGSPEEAVSILEKIVRDEGIEKIVVGISEGEMGRESKAFGEELSQKVGIEVEFEDETLSTQDSQALSILAGAGRKKRKEMEDAFAAALMLQSYLEKKAHV